MKKTSAKKDKKIETPCFVVAIGASAGGLAAFESFFRALAKKDGSSMAFIVVQHMAPDSKSWLRDMIAKRTALKTVEIENGMEIQAGRVHVLPPNREATVRRNRLWLAEPTVPRGRWHPIDALLRSLAVDRRERSVGIVMSGCGMDGTMGLEAIKSVGGLTMAQDLGSAEQTSMPLHAATTGLVDFMLPPEDMPARLAAYVRLASARSAESSAALVRSDESLLAKIFIPIRKQTGYDFVHYKKSAVYRRIERRMAIRQIRRMDKYIRLLLQTPEEIEALVQDLLIGVTGFFRDPDAFEALRGEMAEMLKGKRDGDGLRVWAPGCATGEEAYSLALLLQEEMERCGKNLRVQIFATDIDAQAILRARTGVYSAAQIESVSPEHLARFFVPDPAGGSYRIQRQIRDMLVFSIHDLTKDPPFSKLDMISCRNVLIYMDRSMQRRILAILHYALNSGGVLFLGGSESLGDMADSFVTRNRLRKIYRKKEGAHRGLLPYPGRPDSRENPPVPFDRQQETPSLAEWPPSYRRRAERELLAHFAPASALVTRSGDILYIYGRTGRYLEPCEGEANVNIVRMAREGLRQRLGTALHRAATHRKTVRHAGLRVKTNGDCALVDLSVFPLSHSADFAGASSDLLLVAFDETKPPRPKKNVCKSDPHAAPAKATAGQRARIAGLEDELRAKEDQLRSALEDCEAANKDMRAIANAMQSSHEEMQSANEELETSKEELQVINEELTTVNTELQRKVEELSRAENDMNNILACTGVGVIFVDHDMNILRFTPAATEVIHLIPGDIGRPIGDVAGHFMNYDRLADDVQDVLYSLTTKEIEVLDKVGVWRLLRITPYRTLENVIEGAAITFIEITDRKSMEDRERRLKQAVQAVRRVNRLIVNESDPERLIGEACRILAESLDYRCAWVVLTEPNTTKVRSVASAKASGPFAEVESALKAGQLPPCASQALDPKQPALVVCSSEDCSNCPMPGMPREFNLLACRMDFASRIFGVLIAAVPVEQAMDDDERGYFLELARDFGFALRNMEKASGRR